MADISAMMTALSDLSGYQTSHVGMNDPTQFLEVADVNGDTYVNNTDIQALISLVANNIAGGIGSGSGGSSSMSAVPEPTSVVLLLAGVIGSFPIARAIRHSKRHRVFPTESRLVQKF